MSFSKVLCCLRRISVFEKRLHILDLPEAGGGEPAESPRRAAESRGEPRRVRGESAESQFETEGG